MGYAAARFLGLLTWAINTSDRRAVNANLSVIIPGDHDAGKRKRITRQVFANFYFYLFEFLHSQKHELVRENQNFFVSGKEIFTGLFERKQPFIVVSAHLGNWEIAAEYMDQFGYPINLIIQPHTDQRINDLFINCRRCRHTKLIPLGIGLRNAFKALKKGENLTTVGDWGIGEGEGVEVRFFGQITRFPSGPAVLAVKTKTPLVPGFTIREGSGYFHTYIEPPLTADSSQNEEGQIKELTQNYAAILEKYVNLYPDQWCIFKRVWGNN